MSDSHGQFPQCNRVLEGGNRCTGTLVPFSDYGRDTTNMTYKGWGCTNEKCGFGMAIDNGQIGYIKQIGERPEKTPQGGGNARRS